MHMPARKNLPHLKIMNNLIVDFPAPQNISLWWNLGSLLGLSLAIQLLSGLFLAMFYIPDISMAFSSTIHISRDINFGWLIRSIHANGASLFFICIYLHMARGLYYFSFNLIETWNVGVILYIVLMATAFMGYVLPWGQMSFWGATVITSLLSAIPYLGGDLVNWVWGGFAIDNPTLTRFYALHFLLPFVIAALTMLHVMFLHQTGSKNPLGVSSHMAKLPMHPYFTNKDMMGFFMVGSIFLVFVLFVPTILGDPENYLPANPLSTPLHIKPEWYFLWLYAILRSIPNKLGGVIAMFAAILVMFLFPFIFSNKKLSTAFYPLSQIMFWFLMSSIMILTWIGGCPVEYPYDTIGMVFTMLYFCIVLIYPLVYKIWDMTIQSKSNPQTSSRTLMNSMMPTSMNSTKVSIPLISWMS